MKMNPELLIRVGAALCIFFAWALWEVLAPRRAMLIGRVRRWPANLGIVVLDALLVRLLIPIAAVGMGGGAAAAGRGPLEKKPGGGGMGGGLGISPRLPPAYARPG